MTATETSSGLAGRPLLRALAEGWWLFLIRGIAAIIFAVCAMIWPGLTILTLTLIWGAYALVDGVFALWAAITGKTGGSRWWLAILGLISLAAGVVAIAAPGYTAGILLLAIAIWAIVIGVLQIIGAISLRKEIEGEWLLGISGALAVVFGVLFFLQPVAGALAVVWMISLFSLLFGISCVMLAFKLKQLKG